MKNDTQHILLAGAAPDTGNHGVTALARGAFEGLRRQGETHILYLDNGLGRRDGPNWHPGCTTSLQGFRGGKRLYAADHMVRARLSLALGLKNPIADAFTNAKAVLDVSGGDSFSDIYGYNRFRQIITPKLMALAADTPLILLPQTIGPFKNPVLRHQAVTVLKKSHLVYARDEKSFTDMRQLLGPSFDPKRHRLGVDLAFDLPKSPCGYDVAQNAVGLNVSGLLWHEAEGGRKQFGLKSDYPWLMEQLGRFLLDRGHTLYLIPHVAPTSGAECDLKACKALKRRLSNFGPIIIPENAPENTPENAMDPCQLKDLISQMGWMAGARMHATIAALSTGVPVANMAYSDKPYGVFRQLGVQSEVYDLRTAPAGQLFARLVDAYHKRETVKARIQHHLPRQQDTIAHQMTDILHSIGPLKTAGALAA